MSADRRGEAIQQRTEAREASGDEQAFSFTLFVNGASDLSAHAIADSQRLCEVHFNGRYTLDIIDVQEDPAAVIRSGVVAAPTLVKNEPLPLRRAVGDLSQFERVLRILELPFGPPGATPAEG